MVKKAPFSSNKALVFPRVIGESARYKSAAAIDCSWRSEVDRRKQKPGSREKRKKRRQREERRVVNQSRRRGHREIIRGRMRRRRRREPIGRISRITPRKSQLINSNNSRPNSRKNTHTQRGISYALFDTVAFFCY